MRVAVTGGCGFIGSHTVDMLVDKGHEVIVFDNLSTGSAESLNEGARLYTGDITDRTEIDAFFRAIRPDAVIHLAAQIDVQASMANPAYDASVNIMGTINLLDMCVKYRTGRFIYASSAAVYGNPDYLGVDEDHPLNPESFYGYSKLVPENYISMMSENSGFTFAILRYANVYGPRQRAKGEGGVVAIYTENMRKGSECLIFGDGEQTRDFVYVKDVASANVTALESTESFIVNVSTAEATTVNELFRIMKDQYSYEGKVLYKEPRPGDIGHSWLTNARIGNILGWKPNYTLAEGIGDMAAYED